MEQITPRMAALLDDLKNQSGLTIREIEDQTHIPKTTIAKIFTGEAVPNLRHLIKLAALFGTTVTDLMAQAEHAGPSAAA